MRVYIYIYILETDRFLLHFYFSVPKIAIFFIFWRFIFWPKMVSVFSVFFIVSKNRHFVRKNKRKVTDDWSTEIAGIRQ